MSTDPLSTSADASKVEAQTRPHDGGTTLTEVLAGYADGGFTGSFTAVEGGNVECHQCNSRSNGSRVKTQPSTARPTEKAAIHTAAQRRTDARLGETLAITVPASCHHGRSLVKLRVCFRHARGGLNFPS